jgi:hypothetical protein
MFETMTTTSPKPRTHAVQMSRRPRSQGRRRRSKDQLFDTDGRTIWAKRRKELLQALTAKYQPVDTIEQTAVEQVAAIAVRCEQLSITIVNGEARRSFDEEMVRLGNLMTRILQGLADRQRKVEDESVPMRERLVQGSGEGDDR